MSRITLNQSLWVDNNTYSNIDKSHSYGADAAHFWDMHEVGTPTTLTDVIRGAVMGPRTLSLTPNSPYMGAVGSDVNLIDCVALERNDFLMLTVAKSKGTGNANGFTGFYWVFPDNTKFKNHPYYAAVGDGYRTLPYRKNDVRTIGEIYTHAIVRRGDILEHYCLPRGFIDSLSLVDTPYSSADYTTSFPVPSSTILGHGGYGTPNNNGIGRDITSGTPWDNVSNTAQDIAGIAIYKYAQSAPQMNSVVAGMRWCETEWTTKTPDEKRLYPGWVR